MDLKSALKSGNQGNKPGCRLVVYRQPNTTIKNVVVVGKNPYIMRFTTITTKYHQIYKYELNRQIREYIYTSLNALFRVYYCGAVALVAVGGSPWQRDDTAAEC